MAETDEAKDSSGVQETSEQVEPQADETATSLEAEGDQAAPNPPGTKESDGGEAVGEQPGAPAEGTATEGPRGSQERKDPGPRGDEELVLTDRVRPYGLKEAVKALVPGGKREQSTGEDNPNVDFVLQIEDQWTPFRLDTHSMVVERLSEVPVDAGILYRAVEDDRARMAPAGSGKNLRRTLLREARGEPAWLKDGKLIYFTRETRATHGQRRVAPLARVVLEAARRKTGESAPWPGVVGFTVGDEAGAGVVAAWPVAANGVPGQAVVIPDPTPIGQNEAANEAVQESGIPDYREPIWLTMADLAPVFGDRNAVYPLSTELWGIPKATLSNAAAAAGIALIGVGGAVFTLATLALDQARSERSHLRTQVLPAKEKQVADWVAQHLPAMSGRIEVPWRQGVAQARRIWRPGLKVRFEAETLGWNGGRPRTKVTYVLVADKAKFPTGAQGTHASWVPRRAIENLYKDNPEMRVRWQKVGTNGERFVVALEQSG